MATKKLPEWFIAEFPDWKKNLIGAARALFNGFVGTAATCLITASPDSITTKEFWINSLLIGSIVGGLTYLGKWIRDEFYESTIAQKIPI